MRLLHLSYFPFSFLKDVTYKKRLCECNSWVKLHSFKHSSRKVLVITSVQFLIRCRSSLNNIWTQKKEDKYNRKMHAQQCLLWGFQILQPFILTCYSRLYMRYNWSLESCCIQKQDIIMVLMQMCFLQAGKPEGVD